MAQDDHDKGHRNLDGVGPENRDFLGPEMAICEAGFAPIKTITSHAI